MPNTNMPIIDNFLEKQFFILDIWTLILNPINRAFFYTTLLLSYHFTQVQSPGKFKSLVLYHFERVGMGS